MKIRHCPACAELVHFAPNAPIQKCWNCGQITDFSMVRTFEERLGLWLLRRLDGVLDVPFGSCVRLAQAGRVVLAAVVPFAVIMLLVCNSVDIRGVQNLIDPLFEP